VGDSCMSSGSMEDREWRMETGTSKRKGGGRESMNTRNKVSKV
jgi:hypothetical protein